MAEETETQNAPVEGESDKSPDEGAIDKLVETSTDKTEEKPEETEAEVEKEVESKSEEVIDKEEKKDRDFEKATYKFRELYKTEKAKREELERKINPAATPTAKLPDDLLANATEEEKQGVNLLQHIISQEVSKIAKPLEAQREELVLKEFEEKPYVKELAPQIQAKLNDQPAYLKDQPLETRLEQARRDAIADNLDTITRIAVEVGKEDGFKNRQFKEKQGGLKSSPKRQEGKDDFEQRLNSGEVTDEEFKERQDEVQSIYKKQANLS